MCVCAFVVQPDEADDKALMAGYDALLMAYADALAAVDNIVEVSAVS